jgi:hypothetical protein
MQQLQQKSPCFEAICMPGMTEEYKLNVFFHLEQYSSLKLIFVCEENKAELVKEFEETADLIFKEFGKKKIT